MFKGGREPLLHGLACTTSTLVRVLNGKLMTQLVQLEVDETILDRARGVAERTGQPVEDVLRDWLNEAADNLPVELMSDEQVMSLAESMMVEAEQEHFYKNISITAKFQCGGR